MWITVEMTINNKNFYQQVEEEKMKHKKYRTPAWLERTDFEKGIEERVHNVNFIWTDEMKAWLRRIDSKKHEVDEIRKSEKVNNVNLVSMCEIKQQTDITEEKQDYRESYEMDLRRQRKQEKQRNVDERECISFQKLMFKDIYFQARRPNPK